MRLLKIWLPSGGFARIDLHSKEKNDLGMSGDMLGLSFCTACGVEEGPDQLEVMRNLPVDTIIQKGIGFPSTLFSGGFMISHSGISDPLGFPVLEKLVQ